MPTYSTDQLRLQAFLLSRDPATSGEIQRFIGKSQSSVSRLLADMPEKIARIGSGRSTRYSIQKLIHGMPHEQALYLTGNTGHTEQIGSLQFLTGDLVHIQTHWFETTTHGLPWYLANWKIGGFLGRILARRLQLQGLEGDPDLWNLEDILYSALQINDHPGALELGDLSRVDPLPTLRWDATLNDTLDHLAEDVARTLPAGSSADGEQPKFPALLETADASPPAAVLVKFSPPLSTPFGRRWHDLLTAESLAHTVLHDHGVAAATGHFHVTPKRAYLLSERFDRIGPQGRRHVVSIGAAHRGLLEERYTHWADSAQALQRIGRLDRTEADRVRLLLHFGRLIGNTDMHSGNLSLFVEPERIDRGALTLAPVYDMLPMIWKPDPHKSLDETPFVPDARALGGPAAILAYEFWSRLGDSQEIASTMRAAAHEMAARCQPG